MNPGPPDRARRWRDVGRLLAVRLDNLGDVVMTTPALAAIRESLPDVHLTLLASPAGAAAAAHLPMVDEVWPVAVPWMKPGTAASDRALGRDEAALVDRLAEGHFDAAVIFTVCTQSPLPAALLCRMAGIRLRLAHCRENPYGLLTDWVPETDEVVAGAPLDPQRPAARHEVQRQLALLAAVGLHTQDDHLRFSVHAADRERVVQRLGAHGIAHDMPYAVLHPGASAESRRWPAARFGSVAREIAASGCAVVFSGDSGELALVAQALRAVTAEVADPEADGSVQPMPGMPAMQGPAPASGSFAASANRAGTSAEGAPLARWTQLTGRVGAEQAERVARADRAERGPLNDPSETAAATETGGKLEPGGAPGQAVDHRTDGLLATVDPLQHRDRNGGAASRAHRSDPAPVISLAGLLSLGELAALIANARVLVANNSAPAHLAAALDTPVVNLYALTNPQHTPWRVRARVLNHDVPCRWCLKSQCPQRHHDCLRAVLAPQVAGAALELMRPDPTPGTVATTARNTEVSA